MMFVDANVIVNAFVDGKNREMCREILRGDFVTDALCLVEAQHGISVIRRDSLYAAICIRSLFKSRSLILPLDRNLMFESFRRAGKYRLDVFDMIHYASALVNNCSEFVSYDKDFDGLEIKRTEP